MKLVSLTMLSLALFGSVACASGAESGSEAKVVDGTDGVRVGSPSAPKGDVSPMNATTTTCTASELQQAETHAFVNHTLPGPGAPPVHVTSCNYNASTGYIVYTYAYSYE